MNKSRMRRSDIFKKLTACIIMSDQKERGVIVDSLRSIGIKHFIYYPSFVDACAAFTKFYSTAHPDFILMDSTLTVNTDCPLSNLPILVSTTPISADKLKLGIMNMFKRKFKLCHVK